MEKLDQYISDMSSPQGKLLHELERETYLRVINPRMISGHIQGKLLEMLVRMLRPKRILEIGTFTGYSALSMAAGLEEGALIDTFEIDDELVHAAWCSHKQKISFSLQFSNLQMLIRGFCFSNRNPNLF